MHQMGFVVVIATTPALRQIHIVSHKGTVSL